MIAHTNLDEAKAIFGAHIQDTQNSKGVFTSKLQEYIDCLLFAHVKLEDLMRKDEAHWEENLVMVKRQAQEIHEQVHQLMEQQKKQLQDMLKMSLSQTPMTFKA